MGKTSQFQLPYAEPGDALADWPAADQAAALRTETVFGTSTRFLNVFTAVAGWSLGATYNQIDVCGALAILRVDIVRTGSAISVADAGNITNSQVLTFDNAKFPYIAYGPIVTFSAGRVAVFTMGGASLSLQACTPGASIATNEQFNLVGVGFITPSPTLNP